MELLLNTFYRELPHIPSVKEPIQACLEFVQKELSEDSLKETLEATIFMLKLVRDKISTNRLVEFTYLSLLLKVPNPTEAKKCVHVEFYGVIKTLESLKISEQDILDFGEKQAIYRLYSIMQNKYKSLFSVCLCHFVNVCRKHQTYPLDPMVLRLLCINWIQYPKFNEFPDVVKALIEELHELLIVGKY